MKFLEKEIQEVINLHREELGKEINQEEAVVFLEEVRRKEEFAQEMCDIDVNNFHFFGGGW